MKINSNSTASVNLHTKQYTPSAPSATPQPTEQVQLGATPAPPSLKDFQWGATDKSPQTPLDKNTPWTEDHAIQPQKNPVIHSKMLIAEPEVSPWMKDTGFNNSFFSNESKTIFQEDVVQHETAHAAAGKTFAQLLDEISTKVDSAAQGKDGAAAEKATQKSLEDLSALDQSWLKGPKLAGTDPLAAGKVDMGKVGMGVGMMGMLGGMGAWLGGMGSMMGGMMGGMMGAGLKGPASLAPSDHPPSPIMSMNLGNLAGPASAAPASPIQAPLSLKEMSPDQQVTHVTAAVTSKIAAMGERASFKVDKQLLPLLDKMQMDPVDFFTARACWQGVTSKRRAVLEKVLDQFPTLPKDQKNVDAAMAAVEAQGTKLKETDRYFLKYFFAHRKEMKTLFRSTLNLFEGNQISVYRGQSSSSQYGKDSTKPLGCYSYNPSESAGWGDNLKRFRVKLSDVWSTSVVSQNTNRTEEELTVYSRGGIRKGIPIKKADVPNETSQFKARFQPNEYMTLAKTSW